MLYTRAMPDYIDMHTIQADFDRLAPLARESWDHNSHYHSFLLQHIPPHSKKALEIGCGTGAFARLLAKRVDHGVALDLSPQMIRLARERSEQYPNIDYHIADVLSWEFPAEQFDCIVSIATLHHLPMADMLSKMRDTLKVNGTLIVLDLFQAEGLSDILTSIAATLVNIVLQYIKTGHARVPRNVREAWAEHGRNDSYLTLSQVRRICAAILPGAKVRKHLLWRYSIIWKKTTIA
ncbi:MAG TPA: methyltransferase domain-containing protein [Ktedonobacteraceae bacterium]|nr:methyltransferase domain-containing protein [Ktedonobacteraceae bacterium]